LTEERAMMEETIGLGFLEKKSFGGINLTKEVEDMCTK
jgi:hypothetical protein